MLIKFNEAVGILFTAERALFPLYLNYIPFDFTLALL